MSEMSVGFKGQFMEIKFNYDVMCKVCKLAKQYNVSEAHYKEFIEAKEAIKPDYIDGTFKLLKFFSNNSNIISLPNGWFGVRYLDSKKNLAVRIGMLVERDLYVIERDTRRLRDLSKLEIDNLLPGIEDGVGLEMYNQSILASAKKLIECTTGISLSECEKPEDAASVVVSGHAGKRWVQRKYGISNDSQAEAYKNANLAQIENDILQGFKNAELLWAGADGVEYWFDDDNTVYIFANNTIITLYEEDYGFSKSINRSIVLQQTQVLRECGEHLKEIEAEHGEAVKAIEEQVDAINSEISLLEAQLDLLSSKKQGLVSSRDEQSKIIKVERARFAMEFDKLFKKGEAIG